MAGFEKAGKGESPTAAVAIPLVGVANTPGGGVVVLVGGDEAMPFIGVAKMDDEASAALFDGDEALPFAGVVKIALRVAPEGKNVLLFGTLEGVSEILAPAKFRAVALR